MFTRERAIKRGGGPGDGLCQVEELYILCLTEVGRVVQFLQHDELCATGCDVGDGGSDARAVVIDRGCAGVLDECEFHSSLTSLTFVTTRPFKSRLLWLSLLQKFVIFHSSSSTLPFRGLRGLTKRQHLIAEAEEDGVVGDDEGCTAFLVAGPQQGEGYALAVLLVEG